MLFMVENIDGAVCIKFAVCVMKMKSCYIFVYFSVYKLKAKFNEWVMSTYSLHIL